MDFSKVFAEHDETLLYIYYAMPNEEVRNRSAKELSHRGWSLNENDHTWSVTRTKATKSQTKRPKQANNRGRGDENQEMSRYIFDIENWRVVEDKQQESKSLKRVDDPNSL
jgi:hypothetical protein